MGILVSKKPKIPGARFIMPVRKDDIVITAFPASGICGLHAAFSAYWFDQAYTPNDDTTWLAHRHELIGGTFIIL